MSNMVISATTRERFCAKVTKTDNCWVWRGAIRNKKAGYGCMKVGGIVIDAHRLSHLIFIGPIPSDKLVCHTCDNRLCVNPTHLWLGTHKENRRDCIEKFRWIPWNKGIAWRHGTSQGYHYHKCRCDLCRNTMNKSKAVWRKKTGKH